MNNTFISGGKTTLFPPQQNDLYDSVDGNVLVLSGCRLFTKNGLINVVKIVKNIECDYFIYRIY